MFLGIPFFFVTLSLFEMLGILFFLALSSSFAQSEVLSRWSYNSGQKTFDHGNVQVWAPVWYGSWTNTSVLYVVQNVKGIVNSYVGWYSYDDDKCLSNNPNLSLLIFFFFFFFFLIIIFSKLNFVSYLTKKYT